MSIVKSTLPKSGKLLLLDTQMSNGDKNLKNSFNLALASRRRQLACRLKMRSSPAKLVSSRHKATETKMRIAPYG